jgi:hypothetical protein
MAHRINWKETQTETTTLFNFKWQQNKIGIDYKNLSKVASIKQTVNHFEFHSLISNKCNLFINLLKYCESKNLEVFKFIPFTILFNYNCISYNNQMDNFETLFNNIKDYVYDLSKLKNYKNIFDTNTKSKKFNPSFSVTGDVSNDKTGLKTSIMISPDYYIGKNYWIVKAADLNRGRCIKMADSLNKIQKLIKKFNIGIAKEFLDGINEDNEIPISKNITEDEQKKLMNKYRTNSVIVQKYIENPLLYKGRKFDIRIWVLVTHKMQVYIFREGHLKTSSVPYDINNIDSYVHITNYSIQKYNDNFSKHECGNEVSFKDFQVIIFKFKFKNNKYRHF